MTELGIASVLQFTAVEGLGARLGFPASHQVMNLYTELRTRICAKGSCPQAVMVSVPFLPSCSVLQCSCQKYVEGEQVLQGGMLDRVQTPGEVQGHPERDGAAEAASRASAPSK